KPIPASQHIIDRLGDRERARETGALFAQPGFQRGQKWRTLFQAHPLTLLGALATNTALDIEQRVDALYCFERDDRGRFLAAPSIGRDVRQLEELPSRMGPTECGDDRSLRARRIVQFVVAAVRVRLQAAVGASASLAVTYVSYEFFEKRFLRLKRLFGRAEKQAPQSPRGLGVQASVSRSGWSSKRSG